MSTASGVRRLAGDPLEIPCATLAVPVVDPHRPGPAARRVLERLGLPDLDRVLAPDARPGAWGRVPSLRRIAASEVLFVRVHADPDAAYGHHEAAMVVGRHADPAGETALLVADVDAAGQHTSLMVEGYLLGRYRFDRYRSAPVATPVRLSLVGGADGAADARAIERGIALAGVVNEVRELVDTPANDLTPSGLEAAARVVGERHRLRVRAWAEPELSDGGFGGLLAVGRASDVPPRLVEIGYEGAPNAPTVALVGKGITFDSGGLDLKPNRAMFSMKNDMAGAAAVLGVCAAAAALELGVRVTGYLALAENMPGAGALRPSDVVRHRNGLSTEVVSPDAEGRLVMADVLAYASEQRPHALLAVSTLTGATAVGADLWGIVPRDPQLGRELLDAGLAAADPGWMLPMWGRYRSYLDSHVADQANMATGLTFSVGAVLAALYLDRFVAADVPWAQIDIGACATREDATSTAAWAPGATGAPMRAVVAWLERMAARAIP